MMRYPGGHQFFPLALILICCKNEITKGLIEVHFFYKFITLATLF
jgi:hypothetical protein